MGRSIYFTDLEIEKLIDYVSDSVELLGKADSSKADYLRRTERRYRLRMSIVWKTGNVRCREQKQLLWRMWL